MEITVSQQQARVPVTIFHIKGEINTETYEQLQKQAQQAMGAGVCYLLLDLAQVTYVSSYGIRAISQVFSWLRDSAQGDSAEGDSSRSQPSHRQFLGGRRCVDRYKWVS